MDLNEVKMRINGEENFVLYRLPNEKRAHLISSSRILRFDSFPTDIDSLRNCFIFAPFSTKNHPILAIPSEKSADFETTGTLVENLQDSSFPTSEPTENYRKAFDQFVSAVRSGNFQKLVLSRSCDVEMHKQDSVELFQKACLLYPQAMVYLFHTPQTGSWLGATPELLLAGDETQLRTIALAGTLKNNSPKGFSLSDWGEKERLEQNIVADFIRERIAGFGRCKDEWGPYSISAGHISHLRTDFYFTMEREATAPFLSAIHPTPATCGLPKEEALQFILDHEGIDRTYFAGYLGFIDADRTNLFVNLRCMRLSDHNATLYAGGGILSTSDVTAEWNETEEKMNTLKRVLL